MRYRNVIKLVPVYAALSFLVYTAHGVINESRAIEYVNAANILQSVGIECERAIKKDMKDTEEKPEGPEKQETQTEAPTRIYLDPEDEEILTKIAMSEAGGESVKGKALVMMTVVNRMRSNDFPDTIHEVVFQDKQYSPVSDGRYFTAIPDNDCKEALEMVESGWDESMGAMYFENSGSESWHSKHLEYLFQCGNHKFYR